MRTIALLICAVLGLVSFAAPASANGFCLGFCTFGESYGHRSYYRQPMYAPPGYGYRGFHTRPRNRYADDYPDDVGYRKEGHHRRPECENGDQLTRLPSGREVCVDHNTDQADMRQFGRRRSDVCKGRKGVTVPYNLGDGTVGNYDC